MRKINFNSHYDLICTIIEQFDQLTDIFADIAIIAKYEDARKIIMELILAGYPVESIEIHRPAFNNYHDEYIIQLNFDGIWCEPMKYDGRYNYDESAITYILDNCSSACIPYCHADELYEVSIGNDDDFDCCDCVDEDCPERCLSARARGLESHHAHHGAVTLMVREQFAKLPVTV